MPTEHLVHVYTYVLLHVNMSINDIVGVGVELCMPSFRWPMILVQAQTVSSLDV